MIELTVRVPDQVFERIRHDAAGRHTQPEQVAADALQSIFAPSSEPAPLDVATTVARLRAWISEQPAEAVRLPLALNQLEQTELDRDLAELFATFHRRAKNISQEQIQQDVTHALKHP